MSQSYVLDTSTVLHLIRGKELGQQIDRAFGLKSALHRHVVSIVSHGELRVLAERHNWGDAKRSVLAVALDNLVTLNIESQQLIEAYVRVDECCRGAASGERKMGHNDMWIAATALVAGLPLITTDKDFNHLRNLLKTVHWVDPEQARQRPK